MLQGCELQVNEDDDSYPKDVTHVYAQNHFCDEWNNKRITSLQGDTYECVAFDSKKDHCTELTTIDISLKPQKTGNLRKVLHVKVGARVMLTTNIDVSDGLMNGAVGTVKYVITEEITKRVRVILVEFDNTDVGQEAKSNSQYKHINNKAVPIYKTQAIFPVHGKTSCQASRTQFPLVLAWAITIHKCQGLTLPEIVVDMTPAKGHYTVGQAYVAFSRVTQLDKLHIINYTRQQIRVSQHAQKEMERLHKNTLPPMPKCLFDMIEKQIYLLHLNIGNLKSRLKDIEIDTIMKSAHIISLNETHLVQKDTLTPKMMGITQDVSIFQHDCNNAGGGVALIIHKKFMPEEIVLNSDCEILAVKISEPTKLHIISVYRPPSTPISKFTDELLNIASKLKETPTCIVGDFNEDISITCQRHCSSMLTLIGFKQMVKKNLQQIVEH